MNEELLKPNSFKSKNEKKEESESLPVPTGEMRTRKQSIFRRFADIFFNPEPENPQEYILTNIIIPAIRGMFADALISTIEMKFGSRRTTSTSSKTSYNGYYKASSSNKPTTTSLDEPNRFLTTRGRKGFEEIIAENRGDAQDVLDQLIENLKDFDHATVSEYYEAAGIPCDNFTYNNYGWTDLSGARIERVNGGYLIKMPPIEKLD